MGSGFICTAKSYYAINKRLLFTSTPKRAASLKKSPQFILCGGGRIVGIFLHVKIELPK